MTECLILAIIAAGVIMPAFDEDAFLPLAVFIAPHAVFYYLFTAGGSPFTGEYTQGLAVPVIGIAVAIAYIAALYYTKPSVLAERLSFLGYVSVTINVFSMACWILYLDMWLVNFLVDGFYIAVLFTVLGGNHGRNNFIGIFRRFLNRSHKNSSAPA